MSIPTDVLEVIERALQKSPEFFDTKTLELMLRHKQAFIDLALILRTGEERGAHGVLQLDVPRADPTCRQQRPARSKALLDAGALPVPQAKPA